MSVRYPNKLENLYRGNMTKEQVQLILNIREMEKVPALKRMIFNFPPRLILKSLEEGKSIRNIVIEEEEGNFEQYQGELRDYQTLGVAFMYMSPKSILGDGVGVGKTAEISALINYLKGEGQLKKFLIAVETSALGQTQCEIMRFTGLRIIQMPSDQVNMRKVITRTNWSTVDGVIVKHTALRSDLLSKWLSLHLDEKGMSKIFNTFILDESSVIKNRNTKTFEYTENICNIVSRVHFMNATTFETSIMDIYNQMDMMYDILLPSRYQIEKEYCSFGKKSYWTRGKDGKAQINYSRELQGYRNQEQFKNSLKLVYFGRSKKDVGKELPHTYLTYEVEPTSEQILAINKGYRYMEVLNSPSNVPDAGIQFNRKEVPKLDRLLTLIENEFSNEKVMVYCFHLDAQDVIYKELIKIGRKPIILNGSSTDIERLEIIDSFNNGDRDVLITNIKKSLNLYAGDACIFYTVETNPSKMEQIRGRIDRSVDDKLKTFVLLVYKNTDESRTLMDVVRQRAQDARDLTIDAKTAVDFFIEALESGKEN